MSTTNKIRRTYETILLALVALFFVYPIYWMIKTAFTTDNDLYIHPFALIPSNPTLVNFVAVFQNPYLGDYFRNSIVTALATTALVILVASFAAYSITRFRYRGRDVIAASFLFTQMIPSVLIIIPFYVIMGELHLLNTLFSLVIAYTTFALPIAIWLLRSYFVTIPIEIEESGLTDGCNRLQVLYKLVMPLALPGIAAVSIITFLGAWGDLIFAYTLVNNQTLLTVPAGLASYVSATYFDYGALMAFSFLTAIPPLILFGFVLRYYVSGLTAGAVKR